MHKLTNKEKSIDNINRLVNEYGGKADDWSKKSSSAKKN